MPSILSLFRTINDYCLKSEKTYRDRNTPIEKLDYFNTVFN